MGGSDAVRAVTERRQGLLADHLGLEWREVRLGLVRGRMVVRPVHMAPNGYLHAASVAALADAARVMAAWPACRLTRSAPIELKVNFRDTARGAVECEARLMHGGRTTQVWDAEVRREADGRAIALFPCTQMVLHPPPSTPLAKPPADG